MTPHRCHTYHQLLPAHNRDQRNTQAGPFLEDIPSLIVDSAEDSHWLCQNFIRLAQIFPTHTVYFLLSSTARKRLLSDDSTILSQTLPALFPFSFIDTFSSKSLDASFSEAQNFHTHVILSLLKGAGAI